LAENSIASRLKTFRLSKKLTQKDMASVLGCTIPTYNRYEKGVAVIGTKDLELLYYMGCNLSWLITGKENMVINEDKSESNLIKTITEQSEAAKTTAEALLNFSENAKTTAEALLNFSENAKTTADVIKEQTITIKMLSEKDSKRVNIGDGNISTNIA